jgi:hypothetical protein
MKPKFGISSTFLKPSSICRPGRQQEPHEKNYLVHASSIHGGAFVGAGSLWQKKGGAFMGAGSLSPTQRTKGST